MTITTKYTGNDYPGFFHINLPHPLTMFTFKGHPPYWNSAMREAGIYTKLAL